MPNVNKPVTVTPKDGGKLLSRATGEVAAFPNYVAKQDFRRDYDQEIRREGHDWFHPNLDIPIGNQPYPERQSYPLAGFRNLTDVITTDEGGGEEPVFELVSYWALEEAGNFTTRVDSVNGNDLSHVGGSGVLSAVAGVVGNALNIASATNAGGAGLDPATWNPPVGPSEAGFSICGWYKNDSTAQFGDVQFEFDDASNFEAWMVYLQIGNGLSTLFMENAVLSTSVDIPLASTNGVWNFFRIWFDPSTSLLWFSLNNGTATSVDASPVLPLPAWDHCVIAFVKASLNTSMNYDEIAIFNGILSDSDATAIYNAGAGLAFGPGYPGT